MLKKIKGQGRALQGYRCLGYVKRCKIQIINPKAPLRSARAFPVPHPDIPEKEFRISK